MAAPFDLAVVVDDDPDIALAARLALRDLFQTVTTLSAPEELSAVLKTESPDVIVLDLNFERGATDGREGLDHLGRIMGLDPDAAVVIITAHGAVSTAVEAIKRGASDLVAKPWSNERLAATVRSAAALRRSKIEARVERERSTELGQASIGETPLLGRSEGMSRVRQLIERAAPTDANVLILGENGTGKEIVAREIHRLSRRAGKPMVSIDLGATSESLFESELFGHVKGAFTGAASDRLGRLKAADYSRSVLYSTLSPCDMCSGTVLLYKIPRVVIGENKTFQGPEGYVRSRGVQLEILNLDECIQLMEDFIAARPELWNEDIGV